MPHNIYQKENAMNNGLSKVLFAITILALAVMACASLPSLPGLGGDNGGNGVTSEPNSGNSNNGGGLTLDTALFEDDFSGSHTWGTGTDTDSAVEYVNDGLQMIVFTPQFFVYSTPNQEDYENVHVEVKVQNDSADNTTGFGVLCNQQVTDSAYYYFGVAPNGGYAIAKAAIAKDAVNLASGHSDKIPTDAKSYQIGVDCGNGQLALYVNGELIDSASDPDYTKGGVGLFTWSGDQNSGSNVTFDDFVLTSLQ
jgi:hypothetical protein